MRSQLTRSVFRRLLSNEGLTFTCPTQSTLRPCPRPTGLVSFAPRRRTIFGFSRNPPRQPKEPDVDPGWEAMLEFLKLEKIGARLPPPGELATAFKRYIDYKSRTKQPVNSLQAGHVLRVFEYLREERFGDGNYLLTDNWLATCRKVMRDIPKGDAENHIAVAKALYAEYVRRGHTPLEGLPHTVYLIETLARGGMAEEARELLQRKQEELANIDSNAWKIKQPKLWQHILRGFAIERNEAELLKTVQIMMDKLGPSYDNQDRLYVQEILIGFYVAQDNISATKEWYSKTPNGFLPRPETLASILEICIKYGELKWCKDVFRKVLEKDQIDKNYWDVVLLWAAGAAGKGVEDVARMMDVMIRRSSPSENIRPDITTINGLVKLAMSSKDPYLAERFINLGSKFGIQPNAQTYILQMNYRVDAGDMTGAQAAYNSLQAEEIIDNEDLPAINRYLRALCSRPNTFDRITSILSDLEARKAKLEPRTTSDIAIMYMEREDDEDVNDILQANVYHYTAEERAEIRDQFIKFVLNRKHSNAQAWDAYQILRIAFDETPTALRTELMNEFFDRGRSDMACYVFGHMRQHVLPTRRPVLDTYIACLEGIASCEDAESLDIVHNMFKMDSSMEPNTKLYNALMLAYTSIGNGDRALDFWDDITNSREGPTYQSLEIVFRACEQAPWGDKQASEVWAKMRRMEIEITRDVWHAYIGALAGKGKLEEAKEIIQSGEKDFGLKPDFMTFGIFFNAMPGEDRKEKIEEWGRGMYPDVWEDLEKVGRMTIHEGFTVLFKIKRKWKA